jgi:hypothetical protein
MFFLFVLLFDVLELFTSVGQNNDCGCDLFAQLMQLLVALFDFLIQGLVLNLELLEVNQMQSIC